ncbi:MAG TPA: hypothetical protein VFX16_20275 [Pseudonocardiaceae bacterium]|nr:hypothetical protein [Pseudonocardiaceae bacterium]
MMLEREGSQILTVGPAMGRFTPQWNDAWPLVAVDLTGTTVSDNTILLRWEDLVDAPASLISSTGTAPVPVAPPRLGSLIHGWAVEDTACAQWGGLSAAPLFLFGRRGADLITHALVRLGAQDGLFIRIPQHHHPTGLADLAELLSAALTATNAHREFLNNHQCCLRKFWPDEELEHKITMRGPVDLHAVVTGLRDLVGGPHLPGTIWEYRDDYQIWDFDNYLYEITGPVEEAGYVSFIPDSTGTVIVKRKWFTHDAPRRRETRWRGVPIATSTTSFAGYLRSHVDGDARYRGSFRRTRLDTSCEFTRTGNVYGFMVDWSRPPDRPDIAGLYQVEIEYLHSRTLNDDAADAVDTELATLTAATRTYLDNVGIAHQPGESKLTYLRTLMPAPTP